MSAIGWPALAEQHPCFLVENDEVLDAVGLAHEGKKKRDLYPYAALRPAAAEVIRQVGDEAHAPRFPGEAQRGPAVVVEAERDSLRAADAPAQEFGDRAHAFVARRHRLAALHGGRRRAHRRERQHQPGGEQHGRQQHFDQCEAGCAPACLAHGAATPSTGGNTSRSDDSCTRWRGPPSPQSTCSRRCSSRAAFGSLRRGPRRGSGSLHGATSRCQR